MNFEIIGHLADRREQEIDRHFLKMRQSANVDFDNWRDAKRYRWLRERFIDGVTTAEKFDTSIDKAMQEKKPDGA